MLNKMLIEMLQQQLLFKPYVMCLTSWQLLANILPETVTHLSKYLKTILSVVKSSF